MSHIRTLHDANRTSTPTRLIQLPEQVCIQLDRAAEAIDHRKFHQAASSLDLATKLVARQKEILRHGRKLAIISPLRLQTLRGRLAFALDNLIEALEIHESVAAELQKCSRFRSLTTQEGVALKQLHERSLRRVRLAIEERLEDSGQALLLDKVG